MPDVVLTVNGQDHRGWKDISINRSIEQVAGTFDLTVTDKWADQSEARSVLPGDECTVTIDGETVVTGFVDTVSPRFDPRQHTIQFSGRDKTADIIDCSAIHKTGEWLKSSFKTIATDLCTPFGIHVRLDVNVDGAFEKVSIEEGETVFEILERLARHRGVLLMSDGQGSLVVTRADQARSASTELVQGKNILAGSASYTHLDRYSKYILKGSSQGSDFFNGADAASPKAEVDDNTIRYRPLIIIAEENATIDLLKQRAKWERNVRYGRGQNLTVTVQGWLDGARLWQPLTKVQVKSERLSTNAELLITGVHFVKNERGTVTDLMLSGTKAFDVLAIPETTGDSLWG